MDKGLRILSHPILKVPQRPEISLQFDGKKYLALDGETVASALYANGIKIFSRSEKYHRPRGLFCVEGNCSHCLMRVNGIPNTRVCKTLTEEGMVIESQNAWPSLKHDLASISVLFSRFIRPGFYYKYLKRPRWAYLIYEKMLRKMAGFGKIADHNVVPKSVRKVFAPQILIVGAGISGMKAALTTAVSGAEVWLVEGESGLGGRSAWDTSEISIAPGGKTEPAFAVVREMVDAVMSNPNIKVLTSAKAISWHVDEEVMIVVQSGIYWELKPRRTILATGSYETPVVFGNSDMPGIFLASGLQRLMHRDFVKPGRSALVVTGSDGGYAIAKQLIEAGVHVKAIADSRLPDKERGQVYKIGSNTKTSIYYECRVEKATGRKAVNGAILKSVSDERKVSIDCDVIVVDGPQIPANELAFQKSCRGMYLLESEFQLTRKVAAADDVRVDNEMFIVGSANGCKDPAEKVRQGRLAGTMSVMGMP
ncbi:MAG: 2Fe-2S iron-sulfur cluster-binding protein [Nitrospinales bacterium]